MFVLTENKITMKQNILLLTDKFRNNTPTLHEQPQTIKRKMTSVYKDMKNHNKK